MKKILLTAAIALAGFAVQAQDQTSRTHNMAFNLDLYDIIVMPYTGTFEGSTTPFSAEVDYDGTNKALGYETFTVSSNRMFNVTTQLTALNWTGANGHAYNGTYDVNQNMLASVISFSCEDPAWTAPAVGVPPFTYGAGSGLTSGFGAANFVPYGAYSTPYQVIANGPWGPSLPFTMHWAATPGWEYTGGLYTGNVDVTATQE